MKKLCFFVALICVTGFNYAQELDNANYDPSPVSPKISEFEKHISLPVSLHTGSPNISIPIFNLEYGGMQVPISLSYDASGVRVTETASEVGLKWNLNIGGVLTRIVRGAPDEGLSFQAQTAPNGGSAVQMNGFYKSHGFSNYVADLQGLSDYNKYVENSRTMVDLSRGHLDAEPDLFAFNVLGYSSRFFFDSNRQIIPYLNQDYTIEETFATNVSGYTYFLKWEVTSPNGIKMTFGENNTVEKSYSHDSGQYTNNWQTNSWFLTKLENSKTNRYIEFLYDEENYSNLAITNTPLTSCVSGTGLGDDIGGCVGIGNIIDFISSSSFEAQISSITQNPTYSESSVSTQRISQINAGPYSVVFLASSRDDLYVPVQFLNKPAKKIDDIIVNYNGQCIRKVRLEYGYFNTNKPFPYPQGTSERADKTKKRLKLLKVHFTDCSNAIEKSYVLTYHEEETLPPRLSFAQDKWGCYNGEDSNASLYPAIHRDNNFPNMADRLVRSFYNKLGTLKQIQFPMGGTNEFVYDNHKASTPVNQDITSINWTNLLDIHSNSTLNNYLEGNFTFQVNTNFEVSARINGYASYPTQVNTCQCGGTGFPADPTYYQNTAVEIRETQSGNVVYTKTFNEIRHLMNQVNCTNSWSANPSLILDIGEADGLVNNTGYTVKVYNYNNQFNTNSRCFSTQFLVRQIDNTFTNEDYLVGGLRLKNVIYKDSNGIPVKTDTYEYHDPKLINEPQFFQEMGWDIDITYNGLIDILSLIQNGGPVNGVVDGILQNYDFDQGRFYSIVPGTSFSRTDFSGSHIAYGKVKEYNSEGHTEYNYWNAKTYLELNGYGSSISFPWPPLLQSNKAGKLNSKKIYNEKGDLLINEQNLYQDYTDFSTEVKAMSVSNVGGAGAGVFPITYYSVHPEYVKLNSTTKTQYFDSGVVTTKTDYFYQGNNHNQVTKTIAVDSKKDTIKTKLFYPLDVTLASSLGNDDLSNPEFLSIQDLITKNRISEPVQVETYINNQLQTTQRTNYKDWGSNVLMAENIETLKGAYIPIQNELDQRVIYHKYDLYGRPVEISQEDGTRVVYIWGYDQTVPVAKIENATYSQVASYVSNIQTKSNNDDDRTIDTVSTSDSITYLGEEGALRQALQSLRMALPNAMVTSFTYDPLIGVTSITDPRGQTIYYQYDEFNRLKWVKDAYGKIVSENTYNYKN